MQTIEDKRAAEVLEVLRPWDSACRAVLAHMSTLEAIAGEGGKLMTAVDGVISGYSVMVAEKIGESPDFLDEWVWSNALDGSPMDFLWQGPEESAPSRHSISTLDGLASFISRSQSQEDVCQ